MAEVRENVEVSKKVNRLKCANFEEIDYAKDLLN